MVLQTLKDAEVWVSIKIWHLKLGLRNIPVNQSLHKVKVSIFVRDVFLNLPSRSNKKYFHTPADGVILIS